MSRDNPIESRTATYVELVGNGHLYTVPPFQRDYAWEEEQWEDLWTDLMELLAQPDQRHFLGTLVLESKGFDAVVIDGQQRLATLTILALAILGRLQKLADEGVEPEANRERIVTLRSRFIGEKDPRSLWVTPKLRLNRNDDDFLQSHLVAGRPPPFPQMLSESNARLWACLRFFDRQLEQALGRSGSALAGLLHVTLGRQLVFIVIEVARDLDAYTVFETLNARGVDLSATDLLKNHLLSHFTVTTEQQAIELKWREKVVGPVTPRRFPEFLRAHMACEVPHIRQRRLFQLVRERVHDLQDAYDLLLALEARAELFAAFSAETHTLWADRPGARPAVSALLLFGTPQFTPLLFAAWEKLSAEAFVRIFRLLVVVAFRHVVVGRRNPHELEHPAHRVAKALLAGQCTTPADAFKRLQQVYVSDEVFRSDFERLQVSTNSRTRLARYILAALEADASGRACDFGTDPGTIEHILPESPSEAWAEHVPWARQSDAVYRIGNLTLLEPSLNRSIGNGLLAAKRTTYETSGYALTHALAEQAPEHWTLAAIDHRQKALAARAVHIWRFDP